MSEQQLDLTVDADLVQVIPADQIQAEAAEVDAKDDEELR